MWRLTLMLLLLTAVAVPRVLADDPDRLTILFQRQKDPSAVQRHADTVAEHLSQRLGIPVRAVVPGDYSASVRAIVARQADFAYVSSLPFLLARRDGGATLLLAEQRPDLEGTPRTDYDSVLVVAADSPLQAIDDLKGRTQDLRVCFTSATSTSGYIMPVRHFVQMGLLEPRQDVRRVFRRVSFGEGYAQALREVLAGRADLAAVSGYVMEGPSADVYLPAEDRAKLRILGRIPGVPTHLICARAGLSDQLKQRVADELIELSRTQPQLLTAVYGASTLVRVDEEQHVRSVVEAVEFIGLPIENLAR